MDNFESNTSTIDAPVETVAIIQEVEDPYKFMSYVTGLDPSSEDFAERLIERRDTLRKEYNMPDAMAVSIGEKTNSQYYDELVTRAEKEGIGVSFDLEDHIKRNNLPEYVTGMFSEDGDGRIHIKSDFDRNDGRKIRIFEHELVHALQFKYKPEISPEQKEFQAYLIANTSRMILESPFARDILFGLIHSSSKYQYDVNNKEVPWK